MAQVLKLKLVKTNSDRLPTPFQEFRWMLSPPPLEGRALPGDAALDIAALLGGQL